MTTSQRLKLCLISVLSDQTPDDTIAVVDAKQRTAIALPTLAVDIVGTDKHSEALRHVERVDIAVVLRCHAGDEDDASIDAWIDQIESVLFDASMVKGGAAEMITIFDWSYNGSTQAWDENILEVTFSASCLCSRFEAVD